MPDVTLTADPQLRIEEDSMGSRAVPAEAYYGVHTARALENFPISGIPLSTYPEFVNALAAVKQAAALTNCELGLLDAARCAAIVSACDEIRSGRLHSSFVVDVIQGGAGTSSNMNANEVIANRALEHLGAARGDYHRLHPLEHVNRGQSTNDVYPTAIKVALQMYLSELHDALQEVSAAFRAKADEFRDVLKMGRTQLQDAVPMTLGQEFGAYAVMVAEDAQRLREAAQLVTEINLGGTAIGTGLNTHPRYAERVCATLGALTGIDLSTATDLVEATQDVGAFVQVSGVLKRTAVKLSKICSDLRLLSSGPRSGLGEINLPAVQAGSSIMPGKVNPVIPEVVNQVAFEVVGNDVTISMAAEAGQLQLNAFEPIIAHCLFTSAAHLTAACRTLVQRCIVGITANEQRLAESVTNSIGVITALAPYLGYAESARIAKRALHTGAAIPDLVVAEGLMSAERVAQLLAPDALLNPRSTDQPKEESEA
ncbi:aspartate ammonia-lyase [Mycolicibacterium brisbanense]|uniref:aspartate ammonia-lyase n=1 Tax=Mycolicibacterium brisbanense TaxID=146020 RepID=UPI0007A04846|nr:aspartate ammonia-lyase [Mycolicibacterium brisbanense]MCV7160101.1 aspartate ammonia-lyase [Mycolicibacterium brisbanense]